MKLYLKYIKIQFKGLLEYKTSFLLLILGQFLMPFLAFISIYLLFQRFDNIKGWTLYEVTLCYGIIHISYSISDCFVRGFDTFKIMVKSGSFDRLLVRPRNTVLQVLGSRFEFTRVGRLIQGFLVLAISIMNLTISWNPVKIITLILMILAGISVFAGINILGATLCFWTVEGVEVVNIFTDGGREMTQYPLEIYQSWVKKFFTFVIPFGSVNYYPLMYILGKTNNSILNMFIPLYGIGFIIPCIMIWNFGVKRYKSVGS